MDADNQFEQKFKTLLVAADEHRPPSKKTLELTKIMQEQISNIKINMAEQRRDIEYIKEEVGEIKKLLKDWTCDADMKYASKLTEKIVYGMIGTILGTVLLSIMYLVIRTNP